MRLAVVLAALTPLAACGPDDTSSACKDNLIAGDLVITEVFADYAAPSGGTGTDDGKEWFEIYNNADRPVSLKGLTIVHSRPDDSKAATHTMTDVTVAPGQFFTLGNATSDLVPAYVDYGYSADLGGFYNADGGKLALKCGDSEIDSAIYDTVKSGHSRQLTNQGPPDYTLNDDQASWCEAKDTEFETNNFGTPGQDNDCSPVISGSCLGTTGMRPVVAPLAGDLVITEVMSNPGAVSDTVGEWFEVKALNDVDLNGMNVDRADDSTAAETITSPSCVHLDSGQYGIFVKNVDMAMNGGLPAAPILGTFKFALTASGNIQLLLGGGLIDAVAFTTPELSGKSRQLDPDLTNSIANDTESNFCAGTTAFGAGDLGTPGAANAQCPLVAPPGSCNAGGTIRPIVKPAAGKLVITEIMVNPKVETSPGQQEWIEITNTGATAFDVNGLGIDQAAGTRLPDIITGDCISVPPGGYALFAHTTDPAANGMLTGINATYGFTLSNAGGDVQILDGTTVLDSVTWGAVTAASFDAKTLQLDPDFYDAAANDMATGAGTKWCVGAAPYGDGTNLGTPKTANAQCAGI